MQSLSNFQEALLGVPVGQSGWLIAHCSCVEASFNPIPEIFLHLDVGDQLTVSKSIAASMVSQVSRSLAGQVCMRG